MTKNILILLLIIFFAWGCNSGTEVHDAESEHEHEEPKIFLTSYSENFEVFAEADPLVTGKKSIVLSHFSTLNNFKPVDSGVITIKLMIDGKEVKQTLDKPVRPGIYSFEIEPVVSGGGQIVYEIKTSSGESLITVNDVHVFDSEEAADEAAEASEPTRTNATVFTKEQSWKIEFATDYPVSEPFGQIIKTTAQVQNTPADGMVLTAKTSGTVLFSGNNLLEGNSVSKGQMLCIVSGNSFADNNSTVRYTEAKNNFEKASADYERVRELAKDKIVSEKDLLNAKNLFENTKAVYENLDKNFNPSGQVISAPFTGLIRELYVKNGQFVEAGQQIATISQNNALLLHAEVQQKYAAALGKIQTANIFTTGNNKSFTLEELNGKLVSYGKTVNSDNYLIPVNLQIDNTGDFIAGSFVNLYLKTISSQQTITVPVAALLEEQGNYFVFIQITPELFEKREIKTGATDGIKTEVLAGINQNERIVTKGAVFIKFAQATGALDAHSGHVH